MATSIEKQTIQNIPSMDLDNVLLNLKIISNIKENDKISTAYDTIVIDSNNLLQGTRRFIYTGDSREKSIGMIDNLVKRILELTDDLFEKTELAKHEVRINIEKSTYQSYVDKTRECSPFVDEPIATFQNVTIHLTTAIQGLQNLKITYLGDATTTSKLDLILGKMQNRINKINKLMSLKK